MSSAQHWITHGGAAALLLTSLAACQDGGGNEAAPFDNMASADAAKTAGADNGARGPAAMANSSNSTDKPIDPSAADAVAVVRRYFGLIGSKQTQEAQKLWVDPSQAQEFLRMLGGYSELAARIGMPGDMEGAAGSVYVTVPVTLSGRRSADGEPFGRDETVTLRRANNVDGASAEQRRWRIHGITGKEAEPAEDPSGDGIYHATYHCKDGKVLTVTFDNGAYDARLVFANGKAEVLTGQPVGSGIWYENARYKLRGKGDEATFTDKRAGVDTACSA